MRLNLNQEKQIFEQVAPKVAKQTPSGQSGKEETKRDKTRMLASSPKGARATLDPFMGSAFFPTASMVIYINNRLNKIVNNPSLLIIRELLSCQQCGFRGLWRSLKWQLW